MWMILTNEQTWLLALCAALGLSGPQLLCAGPEKHFAADCVTVMLVSLLRAAEVATADQC